MGEAKRRAEELAKAAEKLSRELADKGMLIEAGWLALKAVWLSPDAPAQQVKDLRWAYMAGAQHLFASLMGALDTGEEPTPADLKRMDLIAAELEAFRQEMEASLPTEGKA
jgi:hypothetical protein